MEQRVDGGWLAERRCCRSDSELVRGVVAGEAAETRPRCDGGGAGRRSVMVDRRSTAAFRRQLSDVTQRHRSTSC